MHTYIYFNEIFYFEMLINFYSSRICHRGHVNNSAFMLVRFSFHLCAFYKKHQEFPGFKNHTFVIAYSKKNIYLRLSDRCGLNRLLLKLRTKNQKHLLSVKII